MRSLVGLMLLSLLVAACGAGPTSATNPSSVTTTSVTTTTVAPIDPGQQLKTAQKQWTDAGISTYRYTFEDECGECLQQGPETVIVWDGFPSSHRAMTVDQMLGAIDSAIERGTPVEVAYDPTMGYPTEVWIDRQARAYDGGTHWLIHHFEPGLPPDATTPGALEEAHNLWKENRPPAYELVTDIICECPFDGTVRAVIEDSEVVDWDVTFTDGTGGQLSPITVDDMFSDLSRILASPDGFTEDGIHYRAFVQYDPHLGFPTWVAMEIEILDADSAYADLPSRLITSVTRLEPVEPAQETETNAELAAARDRWQAAGFDSYNYELTIHDIENASFADFYLVEVRNGAVTSVSQGELPVDEWDIPILPIESLFDLIEGHLLNGATVETLYHDVLGYPVLITVRGPNDFVLVASIAGLDPAG
jgi:hypothetical protein